MTDASAGDCAAEPDPRLASVDVPDAVTTSHTLRTPDGELPYTATVGRVVLRDEVIEDGRHAGFRDAGEIVLVAYCRTDVAPETRPVTFAFNGGPGSSSAWLHMGLLGPRRVLSGDADGRMAPPFGIVDNAETLLAQSDVVIIDPISTGYSRVTAGTPTGRFHGFEQDVEATAETIRRWISDNGRWMSAKFVLGESYGTARATALAVHLQKRCFMSLNGLMVISAALDFGTFKFTSGTDLPYWLYLPTYACIAHYHGLLGERDVTEVRAEAEAFASREYLWALAQGARLTGGERRDVVRRVAELTGLSEAFVERADLRIEHKRFFRELLRERGLTTGRNDGRFTGREADGAGELTTHDPSEDGMSGAYAAAVNHYLAVELGFRTERRYELNTERVLPWDYSSFQGRPFSVTAELGEALRLNPHLRVHVASGYYDATTPYFATEYALAHVPLAAEARARIEQRHYDAGHMMYLHEPSRVQQAADLRAFVAATCAEAGVGSR